MNAPTQWALTFVAVAVADVFWALYVRRIGQGRALAAAVYAMLLFVTGALAVLGYTTDHWLLLPATAGAGAGTWLATWADKKGLL